MSARLTPLLFSGEGVREIIMPTKTLLLILFLLFASLCYAGDFTNYVNPFIGTGGHGHTYPGASAPFGMVQLSPDTRIEGWDACGGYHYSDSIILGFTHTHLSGTGVGDYGDILLMPTVGKVNLSPGDANHPGYRSRFSHKDEKASPGYYSVKLEDYNVKVELTTTKRVGVHRYTFPKTENANIIIDLQHGIGPDHVIESWIKVISDHEIIGFRRSAGWAKDQRLYFAAEFSKPFATFETAVNDSLVNNQKNAEGKNVKAFVRFSTKDGDAVIVKVALSSVSAEGAMKNMKAEVPGWDFDEVRANAEKEWNKELGKIEVSGGTPDQMTTFYTALYHVMLTPNIFSDVDGQYLGMDMKIHRADGFDMYTVFSLWDTFRAEHPLLTIIDQKRTLDFVKSLLAKYDESGTLPVWELASNETWCMIGYHAVPVIVDAYMKGIRDFDVEKAYEAMKHSAMMDHFGLKEYREYGFVPGDKESESVSKTLEYAYDDWCIAQMARELGKNDDFKLFIERSEFWRNLFDPSTGFMRARVNGGWVKPFDPASVNINYTEANAWQYSFFIPQDVNNLNYWLGGDSAFSAKLDSMFYGNSNLSGRSQSDITGMIGQYAQGNEPSHHMAYLYNYAYQPSKTQRTVRLIMDSLYTAKPDGLCGNDDCGQMSAWYVMSAIGLYEVNPCIPNFQIGSPLFSIIKIHLENGKDFQIGMINNAHNNVYINDAKYSSYYTGWNIKKVLMDLRADISKRDSKWKKRVNTFTSLDYAGVDFGTIMNGGMMLYSMSDHANDLWSKRPLIAELPSVYVPGTTFVTVPFVTATGKAFNDSMQIELACTRPGPRILYTLSGEKPNYQSMEYSGSITLRSSCMVKAIAVATLDTLSKSKVMIAEFIKHVPIGKITLNTTYSPQYTGGGNNGLIDGLKGSTDFHLPEWQGYEKENLDAVLDLGSEKALSEISLGCLQDNNSWIFFPQWVEYSFSSDGVTYSTPLRIENNVSPKDEGTLLKEFGSTLNNVKARYIHVVAKNIGICPDWHKGAGGKAWIFADEITVKEK
jgi:predicted alpha-1,2-mannosidase